MGGTTNNKLKPTQTYIPALDGLRAVSIALVLLSHLMIAGHAPPGYRSYFKEIGTVGVSVFFVISGYLITTLLLHEEEKYRRINLRNFFVRRGLRLLPAFYLYLGTVYLLWMAGYIVNIPWHDYVASMLYIRNYFGRGHETGHIWSLSLEEQFYLFWPALLVFFPSRRLFLAGTFIVLVCLWRSLLVFTGRINEWHLLKHTDVRIDTILLGCCLAIIARSALREGVERLLSRSEVAVAALAALIVWNGVGARSIPYSGSLDTTISATLICLLLYWVLLRPETVVGKILQTRGMVWFGKLSYSLYLWQQLFIGSGDSGMSAVRWFPLNLILTVIVAALSYDFLEKPLLRIKTYFEPREPTVNWERKTGSIAWEPSLAGGSWAGVLNVGEAQPR